MAERPIEQMTLRDLFGDAEWLLRELDEHLEQAFRPRVRAVEEVVRSHATPAERDEIPDSTVRSRMAALISSDDFSQQRISRLERLLHAIEEGGQRAILQR